MDHGSAGNSTELVGNKLAIERFKLGLCLFFRLEGESWFSERIWTPNIYIANEVAGSNHAET